jgi:hypothetical protein
MFYKGQSRPLPARGQGADRVCTSLPAA